MCPDQNLVFSRLLFYPLYLSEYEYRDSSVKVWCLTELLRTLGFVWQTMFHYSMYYYNYSHFSFMP